MAMKDTGLGWEAPEEYLVWGAGTDLGYSYRRTYVKKNDGWAVALYVKNQGAWKWRGPMLISTDPNAVVYTWSSVTVGATGSVPYLRRTWYYNIGDWYSYENDYGTAGLQEIITNYDNYLMPESVIYAILNHVGMQPHLSWKARSFIAGFATGLITTEWGDVHEAV